MTAPVPFQDVIDRVRKLAANRPEQTAKCEYFVGHQPHCIVGHALAEFGITELDLRPEDQDSMGFTGDKASVLPWRQWGFEKPTEEQKRWIDTVQQYQDSGLPWGEAVI